LIAVLIGERIRIARLQRSWSETEASERANISRATLRKVESGNLGVAAGTIYELCAMLKVPIVGGLSDVELKQEIKTARLMREALPRRIREGKEEVDDDF
jgi:transcriptional regulator with XRE-family HTH domain